MGQLNTCCPGGIDLDKIKREKKIDTSGKVAGYDSKLTVQKDGVYAKVGDVETWTSKSGIKIVFEGVNMKIGKKNLRIYFDDINSYLDFTSYSKKIKVEDSYIYTTKSGSFYIKYDWDHRIEKYFWGNTHIYSIEDGKRYHLAIYKPYYEYRYVLYQGSNITGIGKRGGKLKWGKNTLKVDRNNNYNLLHNHKADKYNILGNTEKQDDTHFKSSIFFPHNFNIKSDDTRFDLKTTQKGMKIHFWFNLNDSNDAGMEIKGNKVEIKVDHTGYIVKLASYEKKGDFKKKEDKDKNEESKEEEEQKDENADGEENDDSTQTGTEKKDQDELEAVKDKIVVVDSDSEDEDGNTENRKKKGESKELEISMQNQQKPEESKEQQEFQPPVQQVVQNVDSATRKPQEPLNNQEQQVVETDKQVQQEPDQNILEPFNNQEQQVVETEKQVQQEPAQNIINENSKEDNLQEVVQKQVSKENENVQQDQNDEIQQNQQADQEPKIEADNGEQILQNNDNEQPQQQFQAPPKQDEDQQQPIQDAQIDKNEEVQEVQQQDEQQNVQQQPEQDAKVQQNEEVQQVQQQNEDQQHIQKENNENQGEQD